MINFSAGIGVIQLCNPVDKKTVPIVEFRRRRQRRRKSFFTRESSLFPRFERVKILKHFAKIKAKGRCAEEKNYFHMLKTRNCSPELQTSSGRVRVNWSTSHSNLRRDVFAWEFPRVD